MHNDLHFECPNCGESWSIEEIDWERCYACGYHDNEQDDDDDFGDFDLDDDLPPEKTEL